MLHDAPHVRQSKSLQAKFTTGNIIEVLGKHPAALKDTWLYEPLNQNSN